MNFGKNISVGPPCNLRAGGVLFRRLLHQTADIFTLFKMQLIAHAVAINDCIHKFGGILGCTGAQTVQAQAEFIVFACIILIFAACVQLTKHQLPVEAILLGVIIHRNPPAMIAHENGIILETGNLNLFAVALSRLINGIGKDFKKGMLAPIQTVRAEDYPRTQADAFRPL